MVPEPIARLDERYFADLLQIRCKGGADVVPRERSPNTDTGQTLTPKGHRGPDGQQAGCSCRRANPRTGELDGIKTRDPLCAYARRSLQPSRRSAEAVDTTLRPAWESAKGSLQQLVAEAAPTARLSTTTSPGTCPLGETGNEMVLAKPLGDRTGRVFCRLSQVARRHQEEHLMPVMAEPSTHQGPNPLVPGSTDIAKVVVQADWPPIETRARCSCPSGVL
jgi:hypothetical protein